MPFRILFALALLFAGTGTTCGQLTSFTEAFNGGNPQILVDPTVSVSAGEASAVPSIIFGQTEFLDPDPNASTFDTNLDANLLGDGVGDGHVILDTPAGNAGSSTPGINFVIGTITEADIGSTISLDAAVFQAAPPSDGHVTQIAFLLDSDGNDGNDSVFGVEFNASSSTDPTDENFFGPDPNLEDYSVLPVTITAAEVGSVLSVRFELFNNVAGNRDLGIDTIRFNVVAVPEPSSLALFGLVGAALCVRRRR